MRDHSRDWRSATSNRRLHLVPALIVACALVVSACSDGSGEGATTMPTLTTTAPTTTGPPASSTTLADTTTTTTTDTTTTVTESTTSTMPETTTTSTVPASVELSDEGIQAGDTWVYFGYDDEDAIAAVTAVLGAPTDDSGWVDAFSVYGTCPMPVVRGVHWNSLVMLFTQAETDFWTEGVPHFFAFYYTNIPPDLATTEGLMLGQTIADLEMLYGGPDLEVLEDPFDPAAAVWTYQLVGWTGLSGYADSQESDGVILSINGGRGCGD